MKKTVAYTLILLVTNLTFETHAHAANIADSDLVTFESGKKAVASEVNGNFGKVKEAVNSKQNRITGTCGAGSAIKTVNEDGTVVCESVAGATDTSTLQKRVTGTCPSGSSINAIAVDGSVTCEVDDASAATAGVSSITAGIGIATSGATGNVTISVDTTNVQKKLSADASCTAGKVVTSINPDTGVVSCIAPAAGDITAVNTATGSGLTGGATSGDVSLSVDTTKVQSRVAGFCAAGSAIRTVNSDGTVICQSTGATADPGINWATISSTNIDVRTAAVNLATVSINIPAAGYVVVRFDGQGIPSNGDRLILAASNVAGSWGVNDGNIGLTQRGSFSHSRVYSVSAGLQRFYAVAQNYVETAGTGLASIYGTLVVEYFPTKY